MARTIPLHILDGHGEPTIVLLNGAGVTLAHWDKVRPALTELSATFAYDRAPPENVRRFPAEIGRNTVAALRDLLHDAELAPPHLLVAHSMGGLYAQLYARLHPSEVAGLVLVDSSHPAQMRQLEGDHAIMRWGNRVTAWLDRLSGPGIFTEVVLFNAIADEIAAAPAFPPIPLTVLTAGKTPAHWLGQKGIYEQHFTNQRDLAALSPLGQQRVIDSGHLMPRERPEAIIAAVADMLDRLRRRRALPRAP